MLHLIARGGSNVDPKKFLSTSELRSKDEEGQTPLHVASQHNQADLIKMFLRKDPKCVNVQDNSGWTALHMAGNEMALRALEVLLSAKDVQVALPNSDGAPPFLFMLKAAPRDSQRLAQYLNVLSLFLSKGASVDSRNRSLETALHYAILKNNLHGLRFLVQQGADVNAVNKLGETPLHYAVRQKQKEAIHILLDANADRNVVSIEHTSPMDIANQPGFEEILEVLTDHRSELVRQVSNTGSIDSYLWYKGHRKWKRHFFSANGPVLSYSNSMAGDSLRRTIDLTCCTLRPVPTSPAGYDKEYSWEILTKDGQIHVFAAKNAELRTTWLSFLRGLAQQTGQYFPNLTSSDTSLSTSSNSHLTHSIGLSGAPKPRDLVAFFSSDENVVCADCSARNPECLSLKYLSIVCSACAQAHTTFGSQVRNLYFAAATDGQSIGNQVNAQVFERNCAFLERKPTISSSFAARAAYAHEKYQQRTWGSDISIAAPKTLHRLRDATHSRQRNVKSQFGPYYSLLKRHLFARIFFYTPEQIDALTISSEYVAIVDKIVSSLASTSSTVAPTLSSLELLTGVEPTIANLCDQVLATATAIVISAAAELPSAESFPESLLLAYCEAQNPLPNHIILATFQWWIPQLIEFYLLLQGTETARLKIKSYIQMYADIIFRNAAVVVYMLVGKYLDRAPALPGSLSLVEVVSVGSQINEELKKIPARLHSTGGGASCSRSSLSSVVRLDSSESQQDRQAAELKPRLPAVVFHFEDFGAGLAEVLPASFDAAAQQVFLGYQILPSTIPKTLSSQFLFNFPPRNLSEEESYLVFGLDADPFAAHGASALTHASVIALQFAPGLQKHCLGFSQSVLKAVLFTFKRAVETVNSFFCCPDVYDQWTQFRTMIGSCLALLGRSPSTDDCRQILSTLLHQIRWIVPKLVAIAETYQRS